MLVLRCDLRCTSAAAGDEVLLAIRAKGAEQACLARHDLMLAPTVLFFVAIAASVFVLTACLISACFFLRIIERLPSSSY